MTPKDLKTGHICLHANGRYSMVVKDTCEKMANEDQGNLIFHSSNRTAIKSFNNDFTWYGNIGDHQQGMAIIKVYKPNNICNAVQIFSQKDDFNLNDFSLVWDKSLRPEVTLTTELKVGDKVLLHTKEYLKNNFSEKDVQRMFYTYEVYEYLGTEVTIRKLIELIDGSTGFYIDKDGLRSPIFEERMINKEKITQEEKGITMNSLKLRAFKEMLAMAAPIPLEFGASIPARGCDKSFMMDSMLKAMTAAKPAKAKYLTLNVVNGQANVKEMLHQAYFAEIKDPRPFIQDMLKRELIRLHKYLETIAPLKSNLGFNLKLRGMFEALLDIAKKPATSMTAEDAVKIYEFQKAYDNYQAAVQANNGVCPYQWIEIHLTHDNLNTPKTVELFISNKIQIFIKNGLIIYREETAKTEYRFGLEIKFSVADNKFSL